jgi:twitching motility protein PilT
VIETGSPVMLITATGEAPVLKAPLTTPQILLALTEIVPAEMREGFPPDGESKFRYAAPTGAVQIEVFSAAGQLRAVVRPEPPVSLPDEWADPGGGGDPLAALEPMELGTPEDVLNLSDPADAPLELANPAEMMDLAAHGSSGQLFDASPSALELDDGSSPAYLSAPEPPAPPPPEPPRYTPAPPKRAATEPRASRTPAGPVMPVNVGDAGKAMESLLSTMLQRKASDLHLSSDNAPMLRVDGDMVALKDQPTLKSDRLKAMLWSIAPERNKEEWESRKDTDFAHETESARFRVNVFMDRKGIGAVLRQIPTKILSAEDMGLSKAILDLCFLAKGLVLVTGPTGSGKSTTLAAMIDFINRQREDHIITIEDPIEFVHPNKKCLVNQREVGVHTRSFKDALRAALREDPDIVLVGEMRDLETIAIAIETAETGHLVFGTLHTNTAHSTVDRIIDQFPSDRQAQIRMMLSESLKGVVSQTLCKRIGGGRVPAQEILLCSGAVSNLIREGKTFQIPSSMQTGRSAGMSTLNDALLDLVKKKAVEPTEAYLRSVDKAQMRVTLEKAGFKLDPASLG